MIESDKPRWVRNGADLPLHSEGVLQHMIVEESDDIKTAIEKINRNKRNIVFVVDQTQSLLGSLSDGDIRRLFRDGEDPNTRLRTVMRRNPVSVTPTTDIRVIRSKLGANYEDGRVVQLPVVNNDNQVIGFYSYTDQEHLPVAKPQFIGNESRYVAECVESGWLSSRGAFILQFQELFKDYLNVKYALAVTNGTSALHLALVSLGIGRGDEVIVPSLTFIASANAVTYCGATPIFVDVDETTWTIDINSIERSLTRRTKAIIPVHLYGQPCQMDDILVLAAKHDLRVIEDAAQSLGATFKNKHTGTIGDVGCYSFFGNKLVTTGEGGMLVTDDKAVYQRAKTLRNHGVSSDRQYWHTDIGFNYRMTNLQAAIGVAQIERISEIMKKKRTITQLYRQLLTNVGSVTPPPNEVWSDNVCWLFSVLLPTTVNRDFVIDEFARDRIDVRPFFPPIHLMPPYRNDMALPYAEDLANRGICLPSYLDLQSHDIERIVERLDFYVNG